MIFSLLKSLVKHLCYHIILNIGYYLSTYIISSNTIPNIYTFEIQALKYKKIQFISIIERIRTLIARF